VFQPVFWIVSLSIPYAKRLASSQHLPSLSKGAVFLAAANNCDEKWQQHGVGSHWCIGEGMIKLSRRCTSNISKGLLLNQTMIKGVLLVTSSPITAETWACIWKCNVKQREFLNLSHHNLEYNT